ncbi:MAG: DUF6056 family protein [Candidatus Gastranaerophilales bacterium]|nr:DUF6056 family protein [Candidatus Gastranaerophilales bacterium]
MSEKEKQYRIWKLATYLLLFASAVILYLTHRAVPFMMDDLWYSTKLSSEEPIRNLWDIVEAQIWHYQNWGGRSMTHGILQLTLLAGEQAADCLNVLVTFLLAGAVCLTAGVKKGKGAFFALFAATGMSLGLNANWKMSMFWQAGAANYLYITVFVLLYLYCYLRELPDTKTKVSTVKHIPGITLFIIPLGVLAGWSNENMGPALWCVSVGVVWFAWKERRKISLWMILGNLACLIGSVMVVIAPGNFVRSAQAGEEQYGLLWRLFLRCYAESRAAVEYLFPTLLITVFVLIVGKGVLKLTIGRRSLALLFCALLSWGAMILSPHYPDRATFGTMILLICVILSMSRKIIQERGDLFWMFYSAAVLVWLRGMYFLGEFLALTWGWIQ